MDALVLLISLLLVAGAGRTGHADSDNAMDYWQTLLPQTPMPPAILDLLNPHAGSNNLKVVKVISQIGPHYQRVKPEANLKDGKNVHDASQAKEDLKEISVSYGSQGNKKEILDSYLLKRKQDQMKSMTANFKKILAASPQNEENLKEISVSYGSKLGDDVKEISVSYGLEGKQDSKKVSMVGSKKILTARPRNEENLKEISVSYGSKLDEDLKEISVFYGLEGKQDSQKVSVVDLKKILAARQRDEDNLNEISVSYGSKLEEDLKEISVSYGLEGEEDLKEISVSYGVKGEEDLKEISVSYGQQDEDGLKKITASYGLEGDKGEEDVKEISVSYGQENEDGLKKIPTSYGLEGDKGEEDVKEISMSYGHEDEDGVKKITASYGLEGDKEGEGRFHVHAHNHRNKRIADVFFFHDMLRPGTMMTPTIPPTSSLPALLPGHIASSIPFSAKRFAEIVAMFAPASLAMAREMRWTLDTCEHPRPLPGQKAGCATSLESLAELSASLLGTRNVRAFSANMPIEAAGTSALRTRYNVTAARKLSKSLEVVTCHDLTYPYAVFYCHTANPTAAYMVTLESEHGVAPAIEALAVCHLNTSQWNPENPFFRLHSVNPGEVAVCHFLSKLSIIWVRSGELGNVRAYE